MKEKTAIIAITLVGAIGLIGSGHANHDDPGLWNILEWTNNVEDRNLISAYYIHGTGELFIDFHDFISTYRSNNIDIEYYHTIYGYTTLPLAHFEPNFDYGTGTIRINMKSVDGTLNIDPYQQMYVTIDNGAITYYDGGFNKDKNKYLSYTKIYVDRLL